VSAHEVLRQARAAGLTLRVEPPDTLVVRGPREPRERLLPALKEVKLQLIEILSAPADPLVGLYREWLADIKEGSAMVTLDPAQVRQAIAAGAITREVARASVLLVVRSPLGAVGLMSIPREKYDALAIIRAMEDPPCIH
jgi:hypothetical protein